MIILGTNSIKDTGFNVANSCRFNDGSSDNLSGTLSSGSGSDVKGTISLWVKRSHLGTNQVIICGKKANTERVSIGFTTDDYFEIQFQDNTNAYYWRSSAVYRDVSAWYNFIIKLDTGNGTANSRARVWVNNSEITSWSTQETCPQNLKIGFFNDTNTRLVGARGGSSTDKFFDGYIAEVVGINNDLSDNTDFIEVDEDSGIIKPINVSGLTFGTNGFYLDFEDSSALGNDVSGNTNNFTVNNLTAIDQSTDTCTNNMPVINQLTLHSNGVTVSEGNLVATTGDAPWQSTNCTFGLTTGKWYWEFKATESSTNQYLVLGIQSDNLLSSAANGFGYSNNYSYGFKNYNGEFVYNETDGGGSGSYGNAVTDGQIVGVALDLVNLKIYFSINGTYQNSGNPTSGSTGTGSPVTLQSGQTYFPSLVIARAGGTGTIPIGEYNFGSPPYSESGGNSDGNGYGNFKTAPPSGYYSLNTKNLAEYG